MTHLAFDGFEMKRSSSIEMWNQPERVHRIGLIDTIGRLTGGSWIGTGMVDDDVMRVVGRVVGGKDIVTGSRVRLDGSSRSSRRGVRRRISLTIQANGWRASEDRNRVDGLIELGSENLRRSLWVRGRRLLLLLMVMVTTEPFGGRSDDPGDRRGLGGGSTRGGWGLGGG